MASESFDIELVCDALQKCTECETGLDIDQYLKAYQELYRFFQLMGSVFGFVAKDVQEKIALMESYRQSAVGSYYNTVQEMIAYETEDGLLRSTERPSGARTLLRLHRALEFISCFMRSLSQAKPEDKTSTISQNCYKCTLARYHPWLIQKGALVAMYTLPTREQFITKVVGHFDEGAAEAMVRLSDAADKVFNLTEKLYMENDLLDLP